jgi:Surface antigen variable number repeat
MKGADVGADSLVCTDRCVDARIRRMPLRSWGGCQGERGRRPSRTTPSTRTLPTTLLGILITLLFFASTAASAQSFPLVRINITGSHRYTPRALASALKLRTGQQTSQKQLEAASQQLTASGLFSNVEFRFGWAGDGAVVNFDLRDNANLLPVDFENFVWFFPNELATAMKQRLPLFTGVVPLSGDFNQQILRALEQILAARKIEGRVVQIPQGPADGPPRAMFYRVEDHQVTTNCCEFVGTEHADTVALGEIARYVSKIRYEKSEVNRFIRTRLKDIYDSRGYLAAKAPDPQVKVTAQGPRHTTIALTVRVAEGLQYKLGDVTWTGNHAYTASELNEALQPTISKAVNLSRFRDQLSVIRDLYAKRGYLHARLDLVPQITRQSTANITVNVHEGDQYRTGKVFFSGLDPAYADNVLKAWTMRAGEIYDATYPTQFMNHDLNKVIPENLSWDWTRREDLHEDTKTVDLYLNVTFKPREM